MRNQKDLESLRDDAGSQPDGSFGSSLGTAGSHKESSGELGWFARPDLGCDHQSVGKWPPGSDRLINQRHSLSLGPLLPRLYVPQ